MTSADQESSVEGNEQVTFHVKSLLQMEEQMQPDLLSSSSNLFFEVNLTFKLLNLYSQAPA